MKKILSLILVAIMLLSFVACTKDSVNEHVEDGANTNTGTNQETVGTENNEEESNTTATIPDETKDDVENETENPTDGKVENADGKQENDEPFESTKPTEGDKEETKPTEPTKPTTPSHKHKYSGKVTKSATCGAKGIETFTCSCGDYYTKDIAATNKHSWGDWKVVKEPTTTAEGSSQRKCSNCSATESKNIDKVVSTAKENYYTGLKFIGIEHKNTNYNIDGMNFFDKLYGKDNGGQIGDVVTYEIQTSNGKPVDIRINEAQNCTYEITGNILKITFAKLRVWEHYSYLEFYAKTENGKEKLFSTKEFTVVMTGENIIGSEWTEDVIDDYASRLGIKRLHGEEARNAGFTSENYNDYDNIKIPNNVNWFREVINTIDGYKNRGCTIFGYQLVWQDGWQGMAK